jgi:hypothetical protein
LEYISESMLEVAADKFWCRYKVGSVQSRMEAILYCAFLTSSFLENKQLALWPV